MEPHTGGACPDCGGASRVVSSPIDEGPFIGRRRLQYRKCMADGCDSRWVTWFPV